MPHPLLYEINTRCWLRELSDVLGRPITLASVPDSQFASWQRQGFTHIWLMGVWTTGPRSRAEALTHPDLRRAYTEVLPGWQEPDVAGSPYAIADYQVPTALGGEEGLARFRRELHLRGIKLILDFVGNHLGLDHPWLTQRPELLIQSPTSRPGTFSQTTTSGPRWLAHGKDPNFPAWTDTVQLDYRREETQSAMTDLVESLATRCDGVRCDMAMLALSDVFAGSWAPLPISGPPVAGEFWARAIGTVKQAEPDFMFLGEAYWGLEDRLLALGFDYTYDKILYDGLIWRDPAGVHRHVYGIPSRDLEAGAHFLENHDEPRVAPMLSLPEHRAAALLILGLPGMRFLHEGQLTGARTRIPVQLARRPVEPAQPEIVGLYEELLGAAQRTCVGRGTGELLRPQAAWADNPTGQNFVIVQWQAEGRGPGFDLVVANLAAHRSQCYARPSVEALGAHRWLVQDLLSPERYERPGPDLVARGFYLDLPAHGAQLLHFSPSQ